MSGGRYWAGLILGLIAAIAGVYFFGDDLYGFWAKVVVGYLIMSCLTSLIWWSGWGVAALAFFVPVSWVVFVFPWKCMGSGSGVLFVLGLICLIVAEGLAMTIFVFGLTVFLIFSAIGFPFKTIALGLSLLA